MDRLWAPWRINYIKARKGGKCIFCKAGRDPKGGDYVIFRSRHCLAVLNIFPYNNGHIMVSPRRHVADISRLNKEEALDLFRSLNRAKKLLEKIMRPEGYNIGMNIQKSAGAGITGHLHIHIVPRWTGDTNFMPVTSDTRVICQSLEELHKLLKNADSKTN
ncbi:MAG: HIT domain-containing protein [Candidatus Omnitrophica bacterium]|nr:HIT domain-containing protein [Candidatus Omnitrophota bacterium]